MKFGTAEHNQYGRGFEVQTHTHAWRPVLVHAYRLCHALFRHLMLSRSCVDRLLESAMAASSVESFTVEEFGSFLSDKNVDEEVIDNFKGNKVSGAVFLMLTERDINELVPSVGLKPQIRAILKGSNKVWIYLTSHVY